MAGDDTTTSPSPTSEAFDEQVSGIAVLGDPVRRSLYRYVISRAGSVSRDQVAEGAGVARHVVKFHLDKLADDGLLAVEYARPPGRRGPGAGRPAKLYRRSSRELAVSLPQRDYQLAARVLAAAVTGAEREDIAVGVALGRAARTAGRAIGERARRHAGTRPNLLTLFAAARAVLTDCGYEPRSDGVGLVLANCPFDGLVKDYTELVCGMNLELMCGLLDGLQEPDLEAQLEQTPGRCCVRLRTIAHGGGMRSAPGG